MQGEKRARDTLVDAGHWDDVWTSPIRYALPSALNVGTLNLMQLLKAHVRPGDRFLEIGCAPGKILAWVAARLGASVSGLDYSSSGIAQAERLFSALSIPADLRAEDVFETTFPPRTFDVVYSAGVIEHFSDPKAIVARHVALLAPGGTAIITVPNYSGLYGRLQRSLDEANLAIHNLDIMSPTALLELAPRNEGVATRAFEWGRLSPWLLSLDKRLPRPLALFAYHSLNVAGLAQPFRMQSLAPLLVLELTRGPT